MSIVHFFCVQCGAALETSSLARCDLVLCASCGRNVPAPREALGPVNPTGYPLVWPAAVLALLVKFACPQCDEILVADAREEGMEATCAECGTRTRIPRWSRPMAPPVLSELKTVRALRASGQLAALAASRLSDDEVRFLRGLQSPEPEAAA